MHGRGPSHEAILASSSTGAGIARVLAGAWRDQPEPGPLRHNEVAGMVPLLLAGGAGPLGWWKLRRTGLDPEAPPLLDLHQAYRLSRLNAIRRAQDTLLAVEFLRSRGIEPLLIKGWAAARLYPDPGLRPYGDVDLCVAPSEYLSAKEALLGFRGSLCPVDLHRLPTTRLSSGFFSFKTGYEFPELRDRDWEDLISHSEMVPLGEGHVRILGPEHHLRLLCLHFLKHAGYRPLWLCDVGANLEGLAPGFDWGLFLVGDPWRSRWALGTLRLAHELLGARVAGTPAETTRLPQWLAPAILKEWETPFRWQGGRPLVVTALLERPASLFQEIHRRWPGPLESTMNLRGPMTDFPRFPLQLAQFVLRIPEAVRAYRRRHTHPMKTAISVPDPVFKAGVGSRTRS